MKWLTLLMMFFNLHACTATVHIVNVSPIHREGAYGVFLVETQEDLSTFEDGFHAYKVHLCYRIGSAPDWVDFSSIDQFPFTATRIDYADKERRRNVSKWMIPLKDEINISMGRTDSYDISKQAAMLTMVFYGAVVPGGHVVSEPHSVKIEAVK
ncbi:MAG: hypothetical protein HZB23_12300 [Deltaproteobacteria bacterium]|nr:hypothetical protein [Deltaproteobacteria bacterium]